MTRFFLISCASFLMVSLAIAMQGSSITSNELTNALPLQELCLNAIITLFKEKYNDPIVAHNVILKANSLPKPLQKKLYESLNFKENLINLLSGIGGLKSLGVNADGSIIVEGEQTSVHSHTREWDQIQEISCRALPIKAFFSPNNHLALVSYTKETEKYTVDFWNSDNQKRTQISSLKKHCAQHKDNITDVAFSPKEKYAAVSNATTLYLLDYARNKPGLSIDFPAIISQLLFMPDEESLLINLTNQTIEIWNCSQVARLLTLFCAQESTAALNKDGSRIILSSGKGDVKIIDTQSLATLFNTKIEVPVDAAFGCTDTRWVLLTNNELRIGDWKDVSTGFPYIERTLLFARTMKEASPNRLFRPHTLHVSAEKNVCVAATLNGKIIGFDLKKGKEYVHFNIKGLGAIQSLKTGFSPYTIIALQPNPDEKYNHYLVGNCPDIKKIIKKCTPAHALLVYLGQQPENWHLPGVLLLSHLLPALKDMPWELQDRLKNWLAEIPKAPQPQRWCSVS